MTNLNGFTHVDGQEGDQLPARIRSTVKEEPCWFMAKFMVVDDGEASSEVTLIRAWGLEQGDKVINQGRRGPVLHVSGNMSVSVIHRGSCRGWKSWEV